MYLKPQASTELRRHLGFATRASPAPEIRRHLSPELGDQSSTFYLSSTSIFRDYFIPCSSSSSHYQRQDIIFPGHYHRLRRHRHHQLRPSWKYFPDFCSYRADGPTVSNRYQRQDALFLTTITNSGVMHHQRRPAGAYFANSCSHRAG